MSSNTRWTYALALSLALMSIDAVAQWRPHVAIGGATSIEGKWAATLSAGAERPLPGREWFGGKLSFDITALAFSGRDGVVESDLENSVQALTAGLRWRRNGWLLGFSPGLATARTDAISGMLQFLTTAGYQWRHAAVYLQHLSNGSSNGRNIGETMIMFEWQFGPPE